MPWRVGVSPIAALASLARIAIPAYLLFAGLSYLMQDGMIFLPQPRDAQALRAIAVRYPAAQEVRIDTGEGISLHGWFVSAGDRAAPLLVYFGGNAEEVSWLLGEAGSFPGHSLLLVNYRGYGGSGGQSNESALYADALRVFDHGAARPEVDVTRIAVMGRSLGPRWQRMSRRNARCARSCWYHLTTAWWNWGGTTSRCCRWMHC